MADRYDVVVVGAGLVGLATALALVQTTRRRVLVLEAEQRVAAHQSGHNSGVIHAGLYYRPDSEKARLCAAGRAALYRFAAEHGIAHERCGKLVVATHAGERPALAELRRRAQANGLSGVRELSEAELREVEPHAHGVAALHVPETGIIDYREVAATVAGLVVAGGAELRLGARLVGVERRPAGLVLETSQGAVSADNLINCAGLQSDRVARRCGLRPPVRIVPFRGEYYALADRGLLRNLIYPVPDPRFPFLGVHFTRLVGGGFEAGPNAVLAGRRHGYERGRPSLRDCASWCCYPGFWRMAWRFRRVGLYELYRSRSKRAFLRSLQKLVPAVQEADLRPGGAGVRAQALDRQGQLVDDFLIVRAARMVHVLNAPSPAATASLAIGRVIAAGAVRDFGW